MCFEETGIFILADGETRSRLTELARTHLALSHHIERVAIMRMMFSVQTGVKDLGKFVCEFERRHIQFSDEA